MFAFKKPRSKKTGLPPGTLMYIGEEKRDKTKITIIDYDESHYEEKVVEKLEECFPFRDTSTITWINIDGIHQEEIIEEVGTHFGIHPLIQEDIMNTEQRPKMEDFRSYLYIVLKMLYHDGELYTEQVSLICSKKFLISFQEREGDVFNLVRERIKSGMGRIRKSGVDYLAYALMDAIVDKYFAILETLGEVVEDTEEELLTYPDPKTLQSIQQMKREMMVLRKSVWPLREVLNRLERGESSLIEESTQIYIRDVYDHTVEVIDSIETFRDMLSGMLDIYLSSISNKMNEVMKVLTIIATIFIPLTFITGLYGMNFVNMPELGAYWGYPAILVCMAIIGMVMALYFKRKRWL